MAVVLCVLCTLAQTHLKSISRGKSCDQSYLTLSISRKELVRSCACAPGKLIEIEKSFRNEKSCVVQNGIASSSLTLSSLERWVRAISNAINMFEHNQGDTERETAGDNEAATNAIRWVFCFSSRCIYYKTIYHFDRVFKINGHLKL